MLFAKKKKKGETKEKSQKAAEPRERVYQTYPQKVKSRAFELYMEIYPEELRRKYSLPQIVDILKREFKKDPDTEISRMTPSILSFWVRQYGWNGNFLAAMEQAKNAADNEITQGEMYQQITDGMTVNTQRIDKIMKIIDRKTEAAALVDRLSPIVATAIVDMFVINQDHFKKLMMRRGSGWVYDCDRFGARKQLFDMWMAGTNKLLELYNVMPPKKSTMKAKAVNTGDGVEVNVDSETAGGLELGADQFELILKLFGMEQTKGGFGHELRGPNNADFPDKPGTAGPVESGKTSPDSEG